MYAIIETGGRQFWVTPGETIRVEKLTEEPGKELTFQALWAVGDAPEGKEPASSRTAQVKAEVVKQTKGPKIIVFKRRSKKAYRKTKGHRQNYTDIRIKAISIN
jgi:large subunit ribosomal protein L21